MTVLFVMIPIALVLGGGALVAFAIASRRGQFDDLDTPALRVVNEDEI